MTSNPIEGREISMTPATTQVLFVDIQPEIIDGSRINPPDLLIRAAVAIARIGRLFRLPMTASVMPAGPGEPGLIPELAAELPGVVPLVRTAASVFDGAPTAAVIAAHGRHDLVIAA